LVVGPWCCRPDQLNKPSVFEMPGVFAAVFEMQCAPAVHGIVGEFSHIPVPVGIGVYPVSAHAALFESPHIRVAVGVPIGTLAMHAPLIHHSLITVAVWQTDGAPPVAFPVAKAPLVPQSVFINEQTVPVFAVPRDASGVCRQHRQ